MLFFVSNSTLSAMVSGSGGTAFSAMLNEALGANFSLSPHYKPADLGATNYIDQIAYSLSYLHHTGSYTSMNNLFEWSGVNQNFSLKNAGVGSFFLSNSENPSIGLYSGNNVVAQYLKFWAPGRGEGFALRFNKQNLRKDYFPSKLIRDKFSMDIEYPYQIRIMGAFDLRSDSGCGMIRFKDWNSFELFCNKILNGPPKGYWY